MSEIALQFFQFLLGAMLLRDIAQHTANERRSTARVPLPAAAGENPPHRALCASCTELNLELGTARRRERQRIADPNDIVTVHHGYEPLQVDRHRTTQPQHYPHPVGRPDSVLLRIP